MVQQTVTESSMVKRKQRQPQKVPKSPEHVETDYLDNNGEEEETVVKKIHKLTKTAPKFPEFVKTDHEEKEPNAWSFLNEIHTLTFYQTTFSNCYIRTSLKKWDIRI